MKLFYQTAIILLIPFLCKAQSNYKPGYIVNLKGDTIHGFIDYREWDTSPAFIKFKASAESKITKLSPHDINIISISKNAEYQRYAGRITTDPTNTDIMIEERDTTFRTDTVFLELIQRGKNLALYSYSDNIKTRYFIGEQPDYTPVELIYRLYYDFDKASHLSGRTVNEDTYLKQLFALAQKYNCITDLFIRDIEDAEYKEAHLTHIVSMINGISKKKHIKTTN